MSKAQIRAALRESYEDLDADKAVYLDGKNEVALADFLEAATYWGTPVWEAACPTEYTAGYWEVTAVYVLADNEIDALAAAEYWYGSDVDDEFGPATAIRIWEP